MTELMDPLASAFRLDGTNGEAVVLVHGFTGVPAHFRPLAKVLHEAGYTVSVPRLAGHGTSMEDMATTGATDWIASARSAAADVSDHDQVHLAGLSMGGLISLILAKEAKAATVTTINSPVILRSKRTYLAPVTRHFVQKFEWPVDEPLDLDEDMLPYWLPYPGFYTSTMSGLLSILRRAVWAARRLEKRSLVIQSRVDEAVSPRSALILRRLLGEDCRLVWLDSSMHLALLDHERDKIGSAVLARITES